jgi:hypothetical protein
MRAISNGRANKAILWADNFSPKASEIQRPQRPSGDKHDGGQATPPFWHREKIAGIKGLPLTGQIDKQT